MTVQMHLSDRARAVRSSEIRDLLRLADRPGLISLAGGLPDPTGFPVGALLDAVTASLADPTPTLQYTTTEGDPALRALVAARHEEATGRATEPGQVVITTGSQQGLDLLARALGDPGDRVWVEDPAYLGALQAIRAAGLQPVAVRCDGSGIDAEALGQAISSTTRGRFVYTVPTFQNPTGATLTDTRRRAVAALADENDVLVVADEPYAPLRFRGAPTRPLAAHSERVVSLGTVSKTLAPGLRLGWMIGPTELIDAVVRLKQAVDLHTSGLSQRVVLHLLQRQEWFDDHVSMLAAAYGERAAVLRDALDGHLGSRLTITDPDGGMFLWLTPRPGSTPLDCRSLLPLAIAEGTAFVPGSAFAIDDARAHAGSMRVSFATATPAELEVAARRLAAAVAQFDGRSRPRMRRGPLSQVK